MYFSDQITLRSVIPVINSGGFKTGETNTDVTVWADVKSVGRAEFYAADSVGRKIDIVFTVNQEDYAEQMTVVYSSTTYKVERAYNKGLGTVELMCSRLAA